MHHTTKILSLLLCSFITLTTGTESENDYSLRYSVLLESTIFLAIFQDKDLKGLSNVISVEKCLAKLPAPFSKNISSILSFDCFNLYKEENCSGDYIVLKPIGSIQHELSRWGDFDKNVSSIGICYPCHAGDKQIQPQNKSTSITLYSYNGFKGYNNDLEIKDCTPIPRTLQGRIKSISMYHDSCIQLHQFRDCTGASVELRKGSLYYHNLKTDGAISLCGYNYNCTTRETENITDVPNRPNHVRIFNMAGYQGIYKDLNFGPGCFDISDDWEGQSMSIQTYGKCVTIFELNDCNETARFLNLNDSNNEIHENLTTGNFDRLIRSIKLCDSKAVEDNYENLDQVSNSKLHILVYLVLTLLLIGLFGIFTVVLLIRKINRKRMEARSNMDEVTLFPHAWDNPETDSTNFL